MTVEDFGTPPAKRLHHASSPDSFLNAVIAQATAKGSSMQFLKHFRKKKVPLGFEYALHILDFLSTGKQTANDFCEFSKAKLDREACKEACEATRDQCNQKKWHKLRYGRLTAPRKYEAATCKTVEGSLVESLTGRLQIRETEAKNRINLSQSYMTMTSDSGSGSENDEKEATEAMHLNTDPENPEEDVEQRPLIQVHPPTASPPPDHSSSDFRTSWIYLLRKNDLLLQLQKFNLDDSGNVEQLRRRLARFIRDGKATPQPSGNGAFVFPPPSTTTPVPTASLITTTTITWTTSAASTATQSAGSSGTTTTAVTTTNGHPKDT
ncbi:unnamed protein product [Ceutorhynchus assimilis]|uniref:Uncharacterized protein n=1 Tax=Ceutorhynchus assimilis TaxID=467358 RepID=A0A9N9QSY4_9CUCU|nr:unnamed protein product [Ceutorhynchus assimilis]